MYVCMYVCHDVCKKTINKVKAQRLNSNNGATCKLSKIDQYMVRQLEKSLNTGLLCIYSVYM